MTTIAAALRECHAALSKAGSDEARAEARLIIMTATGLDEAGLIVHDCDEMSKDALARAKDATGKRAEGIPLAYVLGFRDFFGLRLAVSPAVLIPRNETEILVEQALSAPFATACDLGTGSGAVILAIKSSRPKAQCWACDLSEEALEVARGNALALGLEVSFVRSSWLLSDEFSGMRFDLIVSNPPYIEEGDPHLARTSLPCEPRMALTSGKDGLDDIRAIAAQAPSHLNKGGRLLLEHGFDQGERVRGILRKAGFSDVRTARDLEGRERVTSGAMAQAD